MPIRIIGIASLRPPSALRWRAAAEEGSTQGTLIWRDDSCFLRLQDP